MAEDPKEKEKEDAIFCVDTVPPPPGEGDAYSAPTTVGPVNEAVIEAMRKAGVPEELIPSNYRKPAQPPPPVPPLADLAAAQRADLPRFYETKNEDVAPVLHPSPPRVSLQRSPAAAIRAEIAAALVAAWQWARFDAPPRIVALLVIAVLAIATCVALVASLR